MTLGSVTPLTSLAASAFVLAWVSAVNGARVDGPATAAMSTRFSTSWKLGTAAFIGTPDGGREGLSPFLFRTADGAWFGQTGGLGRGASADDARPA